MWKICHYGHFPGDPLRCHYAQVLLYFLVHFSLKKIQLIPSFFAGKNIRFLTQSYT